MMNKIIFTLLICSILFAGGGSSGQICVRVVEAPKVTEQKAVEIITAEGIEIDTNEIYDAPVSVSYDYETIRVVDKIEKRYWFEEVTCDTTYTDKKIIRKTIRVID